VFGSLTISERMTVFNCQTILGERFRVKKSDHKKVGVKNPTICYVKKVIILKVRPCIFLKDYFPIPLFCISGVLGCLVWDVLWVGRYFS